MWTNSVLIVDLYDDGTPIPKTQWTEQEIEFFASPKFRCMLYENKLIKSTPTCIRENLQIYISSNKSHTSWWRVHEFMGGTATVWRLPPNHLPLPNILRDADINTHQVLTGIRIREVSYRDATVDEIVEDIRNRIRDGDPKGNIRVQVEPPTGGVWPGREQKYNIGLRDLSVMDLLDALSNAFCLVSIRFDGKNIIIMMPKGSDSAGAPPSGSPAGQH